MHLSKPIIAVLLAGIAAAGLVTTTIALMPQSFSFFGFRNSANGNFTISSSPSRLTLQPGSSITVALTLVSTNGLDASISLSASTNSGPKSSLTATLYQATISVKPGEPATTYVEITATTAASPGHYNATVSATSGSISHSISIPITVIPPSPDFAMGASPSVIDASQTTTMTLTVESLWGFTGNVTLNSSISPQVNGSPTVSFANNSLTVSPTKQAFTIVTVTIGTSTVSGNYTIGLYGTSGLLHRSIYIPVTIANSNRESLYLQSSLFSSGSNVTVYLRNTGNVTVQLTDYYVVDASGDEYYNLAWSGPSINPSAGGIANVLIPPNCSPCVRVGSAFNFTAGNSYTILFVTSRNNQFTFTVTYTVRESLNFENYSFPSNTSVTLDIRNVGVTSVSFVSYTITDSRGDVYSLASWSGPTINPNQLGTPTLYIGSSCSGCTLTGSPFNFTINYPYTITIVTGRNNTFSFQVA